jgi:hypothetical protein
LAFPNQRIKHNRRANYPLSQLLPEDTLPARQAAAEQIILLFLSFLR